MLYRLEIENFLSIRDLQVIDLRIDAKVPDPDGRYAPIFKGSDLRAPKVVALYGAKVGEPMTLPLVPKRRLRKRRQPPPPPGKKSKTPPMPLCKKLLKAWKRPLKKSRKPRIGKIDRILRPR